VYEVQLRYENRPDLEWIGIPLGPHDENAMKRVRQSTPVLLQSKVLTFHVR
jgi:L-alanine-DL-glutamate epimerase-like enolase superfamily enzyme